MFKSNRNESLSECGTFLQNAEWHTKGGLHMNVTVLHYYSYRIVLIDIALRTNPSPPRRVGKCEEVLRGIIVCVRYAIW